MERMLDSLLLGERVRLNFCLKQMTVILRDAVTECSSEVQANYLGGRGIQTNILLLHNKTTTKINF